MFSLFYVFRVCLIARFRVEVYYLHYVMPDHIVRVFLAVLSLLCEEEELLNGTLVDTDLREFVVPS